MPSQVSPALLATYLVAATHQIRDGQELTERSRWAIAHASHQLRSSRQVLAGERPFLPSATDVGLRQLEEDGGSELADLALRTDPEAPSEGGLEQQEDRALRRLDGVLSALATMVEADSSPAALDAASEISKAFATPEAAAVR